ncbi:MAG: hypothetical protein Q8Q18_03730 [bacterium]|nr:hypothetical protein [bacterium]
MPDKIEKFLRKLNHRHAVIIREILGRVESGQLDGLDIKKLVGQQNRFRVRKGDVRIKFSLNRDGKAIGIEIQWRTDNTYSN